MGFKINHDKKVILGPQRGLFVPFKSKPSGGGPSPPSFSNTISTFFDGLSNYAEQSSPGANLTTGITNQMSLFLWIKTPGIAGTGAAMSHWSGSNQKWFFGQVSGGNFECILSSNGSALTKRYSFSNANHALITDNTNWYHVGFVYDGTAAAADQVKIFLNGSDVTGSGAGASTTGSATNLSTLYQPPVTVIRMGSTSTSFRYPGYIDEPVIFDVPLTGAEVTELYNGGVPFDLTTHSKEADIVSWWRNGDGDSYPTIADQVSSNDWTVIDGTSGDFVSDVP